MLVYFIVALFSAIILAAFFYKDRIISIIQSMKGKSSQLEAVTALLPETTLALEPSSPNEWFDKAQLEKDEANLEKHGLSHQGYFAYNTNQNTVEVSLWKYREAVTIAIYNTLWKNQEGHNRAQYSHEVMARLDNGNTLCISNSPSANILPRHPDHKIISSDSQNIFDLMKMLKPNTPEGRKIVLSNDSKALIARAYEDQSQWLWRESQLISSAFESACNLQDIHLSDDDIDELINIGQKKLSKAYVNQILTRLEKSSQISEDKWDKMRNNLVVVHEEMKAEDLSDILYRLVTNLSDDQEEILETLAETGELTNPIESFNELIASLKPDAKRIAKMQHPVASEIYLANY